MKDDTQGDVLPYIPIRSGYLVITHRTTPQTYFSHNNYIIALLLVTGLVNITKQPQHTT